MQIPLQITFRHLLPSASVESRVRKSLEHLRRFTTRITACHVVISAPAGHRTTGAPYTISIDLVMPGRHLCVDTGRAEKAAHLNVYVALRDAFEILRRQLHDYEQQHTGARRRRPAGSDSPARKLPAPPTP